MKKTILLVPLLILLSARLSYPAVYEASTLYNATARSETVQALFQERWDGLMDKNFYFDIACRVNWVYNFDINTWNSGSMQYEPEDLNLVRTYGSMILAYPIGGFMDSSGEKNTDYLIAFSMMGYHYGLTKQITINRGSGGSETVTDYKHSQFFDDIYALSFLWRPYIYLHAGLITNNEYKPEDDGTMEYSDPVSSSKRFFFSSNLLSVFDLQVNASDEDIETFSTSLKVTPLIYIFKPDAARNPYVPLFTIGYSYRDEYNDEPYDAVWVKTPDAETANSGKDKGRLSLFSFLINQKLGKYFSIDLFASMQYVSQRIYDKQTLNEINVPLFKESYCLLNFNTDSTQASWLKIYTGASWYWDPAIHVHRDRGTGNALWGWILGADANMEVWGCSAQVVYDYSSELKKLVETSNKWSFDISAYFRI